MEQCKERMKMVRLITRLFIIIQETKAKKWRDVRYEKGGFDSIKEVESSGFGGCM